MPSRQPFTTLCQALARPRWQGRADLHVHTIYSDGSYSPAQVVELARRSGLAAVAVTDHDTLAGVRPAQEAAVGSGVEVIPGVEITAEFEGRELHLLGYFVRLEDGPLTAALQRLEAARVTRYQDMLERLRACGVTFAAAAGEPGASTGTLGRRHLAELLVKTGRASTVREAFHRYLKDGGRIAAPKLRLPVEEALALVRGAGGVAAWAHPSYDCTQTSLARLRDHGLAAVEAEYPTHRPSRIRELRAWAAALGLAVTGGSDCHGPEPLGRALGTRSVTGEELERLREKATS